MRIIGRLLLILFAYAVATFMATCAFTIANVITEFRPNVFSLALLGNAISTAYFFWLVLISWLAAIPFLLAIFVSEFFAIRSFLLHLAGGIIVALLTTLAATVFLFSGRIAVDNGAQLLLVIIAGIAAGFFYWLIAGRSAGSWRAAA